MCWFKKYKAPEKSTSPGFIKCADLKNKRGEAENVKNPDGTTFKMC